MKLLRSIACVGLVAAVPTPAADTALIKTLTNDDLGVGPDDQPSLTASAFPFFGSNSTIAIDLSGATATQSSTWTPGAAYDGKGLNGSPGGAADKALTNSPNNACNDGGTLAECTCTNTQSETSPWWKMELPTAAHNAAGKSSKYNGGFSITGVSILNRNSLQDRLNGVTITIGTANNATKSECKPGKPSAAGSSEVAAQSDSKFLPLFGGAPEGTAVSGWNNFVCDSTIKGITSITVQLPGLTNYLTICGIQVFTVKAGAVMPAPSSA